jgi:hypothetical protein
VPRTLPLIRLQTCAFEHLSLPATSLTVSTLGSSKGSDLLASVVHEWPEVITLHPAETSVGLNYPRVNERTRF